MGFPYFLLANNCYLLVNSKPHKIRLYRLFVCYKCVTKKHFYLFLNTYRHFLFLCSSIISTCLLCFSYSACNSALRKAIYSTVEVNPCSLNLFILFLYAPASTISNFFNNSRFALPIRNRRNPFSFVCLLALWLRPILWLLLPLSDYL